MIRVAIALTVLLVGICHADEGMWTLDNPPIEQMKRSIGFAPSQEWLDRAMRGSARLTLGCSASFVSRDGLVLTNHHCVTECLAQLSSKAKDYLTDGFIARRRADETVCPAMEINRLEAITDVTSDVTAATAGKKGIEFKKAQDAVSAKLTSACVGDEGKKVRCDIVDLYHGGQYKLYRYRRYQDVRLVFAPEQEIADFGGDPDNFNFPRFDLDFSLVRVYENGKPLKAADYFPISATGPSAGEAVFVFGNPGSTQRELTTAQLASLRDVKIPAYLFRLLERRGILEQYRTEGAEPARIANSDLFFIENSVKALRGEFDALHDERLFGGMRERENELRQYVAADPALGQSTAGAWDEIAKAEADLLNFRDLYRQLEQGLAFDSQYFEIARSLVRGAVERKKADAERLPEFHTAALPQLEADLFSSAPIYPEYEKLKLKFALTKMREDLGADARLVHQVLGRESPEQLAAKLVDGTKLGDLSVRHALWDDAQEAIDKSNDPFIRLAASVDPQAREVRKRFEDEVEARIQKNSELIAHARFVRSGTKVYPDATFTLRMSYGTVTGWKERDAQVPPFTTIAGAFERATGAPPFALTKSWLEAKGRLDLTKPLNFVTNNDIIGGNSGSPVLNTKGQLVGLVFDGNIHSLGGAFWFDPEENRTVAVDSAAILEALDKVYGCKELRDELAGQ